MTPAGEALLAVALHGAVAATDLPAQDLQGDWEHSPGRPFVGRSALARGGPWYYEARFTNALQAVGSEMASDRASYDKQNRATPVTHLL